MHITCTGLNHQTAPLALRERLAFTTDALAQTLQQFSARSGAAPNLEFPSELIILSTCNRTEAYAISAQPDGSALAGYLAAARSLPFDEIFGHLYTYTDSDAVAHLFNVASGLDSLVLGEPQILGQVGRALELAQHAGVAGPLLTRLFHSAIHAGKRARAETNIGRNPASVASLAANLCSQAHPDLAGSQALVIGAGEMAELAVEALRKRGVQRIQVINRCVERAQALAHRWQAEAGGFAELLPALRRADVVISSTGSPDPVIDFDIVRLAMTGRVHRPLVLIDIAMPRDIHPDVGALAGVRLYDLDDLHAALEHSLAERRRAIPHVQSILTAEQTAFDEYFHSQELLPVIAELHQWADEIRQAELQRTLRKLPELSDTERERIEAMTQALVRKLLDHPTRSLRAEAGRPQARARARALRSLFGLSGGERPSPRPYDQPTGGHSD